MEANILYNGKYLNEKKHNTSIFLHEDNIITIIHLVEYQNSLFKRMIEFKKYPNSENKYLSFSIHLTSTIVFSGEILLDKNSNILSSNLSYQFLKVNGTTIIETFYINFDNARKLELLYLNNKTRESSLLLKENYSKNTDIDVLLFNMINYINNMRSIRKQSLIPLIFSISQILVIEREIIDFIGKRNYPETETFINNYERIPSLKRNRQHNEN